MDANLGNAPFWLSVSVKMTSYTLLVFVTRSIHPKDARPQISNPTGDLQAPKCPVKTPRL